MKKLIIVIILFEVVSIKAQIKDEILLKKGVLSDTQLNDYIETFKLVNDQNRMVEYGIMLSKNKKIVLKDIKSKKIIETYHQPDLKKIPNPTLTCEQQEQQQWDYYRRNIYPNILANANRNCYPIRYCLGITCNGQYQVFYMLLIKPNSWRCKILSEATYISKYQFKE